MYEESVSHCPINVTWFPFDDQRCYLVYESWKYNASQLNITSSLQQHLHHFHHSEQWELLGAYSTTVVWRFLQLTGDVNNETYLKTKTKTFYAASNVSTK